MAIIRTEKGESRPNFLSSAVGLVTKTYQIEESLGTAQGCKKIVPAGTIFPSNDANAIGIIFHDVDVTGDGINNEGAPGAVMIAGRVLLERLPVTLDPAAETALNASGIFFDTSPETTRP